MAVRDYLSVYYSKAFDYCVGIRQLTKICHKGHEKEEEEVEDNARMLLPLVFLCLAKKS